MRLLMNEPGTGAVKPVKVGWSWTCFFFWQFFGIPLFLRGLIGPGIFAAVVGLLGFVIEPFSRIFIAAPLLATENSPPDMAALAGGVAIYLIINSPFIASSVYWGRYGNKKYLLRLLEHGWIPLDLDDPVFDHAQSKWNLGGSPLVQRALAHKRCPSCGEEILADAHKCKHCGERLEGGSGPSEFADSPIRGSHAGAGVAPASRLSFCTQCGTRIASDAARFCATCGAALPIVGESTAAPHIVAAIVRSTTAGVSGLPDSTAIAPGLAYAGAESFRGPLFADESRSRAAGPIIAVGVALLTIVTLAVMAALLYQRQFAATQEPAATSRPPEPQASSEIIADRSGQPMSADDARSRLFTWLNANPQYDVDRNCVFATEPAYVNRGYTIELFAAQCAAFPTPQTLGHWRVDAFNGDVFVQGSDGRYALPSANTEDTRSEDADTQSIQEELAREPAILPSSESADASGNQVPQLEQGIYRPGSGVINPRILREVKPQYTADAMRAKVQGTVLLECVVLPDGTVGRVDVVKSLDSTFGLDQEAVKAAKQWRFQPGTRFGEPVAVLVTLELTFTLR
jgi:TonB family protein